jgi:hypothetical protein
MNGSIIPIADVLAELEQKSKDCDTRATQKTEPEATMLRELAELYRGWKKSLQSGLWTS